MNFLLGLFKGVGGKVAGIAAAIGGFALLLLGARKSGEATIKQQNVENTLKQVQERDKVENTVNAASSSELDKLQDKWTTK